ncbi:hypothetical protein M0811_05460 [Anaeramoeba ignava]|uniref:Uncharacterized protein n=1 Tax=Anaeramoeba ignava TaxID=1746090 RepID=A0A9Q0LSA0_ANAIG|nr:hypothetical protein M0811_05460 [Anaeramoeba ignava]
MCNFQKVKKNRENSVLQHLMTIESAKECFEFVGNLVNGKIVEEDFLEFVREECFKSIMKEQTIEGRNWKNENLNSNQKNRKRKENELTTFNFSNSQETNFSQHTDISTPQNQRALSFIYYCGIFEQNPGTLETEKKEFKKKEEENEELNKKNIKLEEKLTNSLKENSVLRITIEEILNEYNKISLKNFQLDSNLQMLKKRNIYLENEKKRF